MIAIPFVVMIAALFLGSSMFRTFRILAGVPAAVTRPPGRHSRPRHSPSRRVITFGRTQFGTERAWRYYTLAPGGADERTHESAPLGLPTAGAA
jgi:hypothetical protein